MPIQIYTIEDTAQLLQVRKDFVYDLIFCGRLKAIRLSPKRFRVSSVALEEFLRQEEEQYAENHKNCQ